MRTIAAIDVRAAVATVRDPEIPVCSIVDLGLVHDVVVEGDSITVELLPTFAGCPALDAIREDVERAVRALAPGAHLTVRYRTSPPWTSDRITEAGREAMRSYGLAPPGASGSVPVRLGRPASIRCPYCGADATHEEGAFGPTPCRAIRYCPACRNPFEAFKPKG